MSMLVLPRMGEVEGFFQGEVPRFLAGHESLIAAETLTPEVAIESIQVLGHTRLMDAYFGHGTKTKKFQLATENYWDKFKDLIKRAYTLIANLVKKCLEWIKSFFTKNKKDPKAANAAIKGAIALVQPKVDRAAHQVPLNTAKSIIQEYKLDERFQGNVTPTMLDVLIDGRYTKQVVGLATLLEHNGAGAEMAVTLDDLAEWYKSQLNQAQNLSKLEGEANGPSSLEKLKAKKALNTSRDTFSHAMNSGTTTILNGQGKDTDELRSAMFEAQDLRDSLGKPATLEMLYDLRTFCDTVTTSYERSMNLNLHALVVRWQKDLEALDKQLQKTLNAMESVLEKVYDDGEQASYLAQVHQEYFNGLNALPKRIVNFNQSLMMVMQYDDDSSRLFYQGMVYIANAAQALHEKEANDDMEELHISAAKAVQALRQTGLF